jgi:putative salt-induced outer membrane protein YdiY
MKKTLVFAIAIMPALLSAQDPAAPPLPKWTYSAKLTAVWVGGNSESSTFGLGSTLRRQGERNDLKFEVGGIRTESSLKDRTAVGTATSFQVTENETKRKTAESYFARARYDRKLASGIVLFGGADWLRNTFSGIDSRTLVAVGAGRQWADRDDFKFKTDLGLTYTFQEDVVENPFVKTKFPGVRFSADLQRALTATTRWESVLISDLNIDETDDVRVDFTNAVSVSISTHLALKPSLQLLWRNLPALTEMDLFTNSGQSTGSKVQVPLEKLDTFFTLALVITL